ncbi:MAG: beta-galactosidase [Spirochaetes bacterium]|nr:beta-galactosidase [Spirochaetota bacterium]
MTNNSTPPRIRPLNALAALFTLTILTLSFSIAAEEKLIFDPGSAESIASAQKKEVIVRRDDGLLIMQPAEGFSYSWPGCIFPLSPAIDCSAYRELTLDAANIGPVSIEVGFKVTCENAAGKKVSEEKRFTIPPGTTTMRFAAPPRPGDANRPVLFLMRGIPSWAERPNSKASAFELSRVVEIAVHFVRPATAALVRFGKVHARGSATESDAPPSPVYPIFDEYGQYRHADWPGKIHSLAELSTGAAAELAEYTAKPRPEEWDQYGGWTKGPQFPATGFFYVTNLQGRWWFIDPLGKLFFAHGIHGVRYGTASPVTEREQWFENLPAANDAELGSFWEKYNAWGSWYYKEGLPVRAYNFTQANLRRKYGAGWRNAFDELCTRRLPSWGMNTIGAGSTMSICDLRRMAYYLYVVPKAPVLAAAKGYWANFYDVFDPGFATGVRQALAGMAKTRADDPWLLGVGVDNELTWGIPGASSLAVSTLQCPANQKGKQVFVDDLRAKYSTIESLNTQWGTAHASWDALLAATNAPDPKRAAPDLAAFNEKTIDTYFRICRDGVREIFPHHLYTGCRFSHVQPDVDPIAHRYCDVVSHNHYKWNVDELKPKVDNPRPIMITEFHFNAPDRGYFSPSGLLEVPDQKTRGERYQAYLKSALKHPLVIGTFWFLYQHQPASGRFDGENYSAGFVDCVDTPIREMADASRAVGYSMYTIRSEK